MDCVTGIHLWFISSLTKSGVWSEHVHSNTIVSSNTRAKLILYCIDLIQTQQRNTELDIIQNTTILKRLVEHGSDCSFM